MVRWKQWKSKIQLPQLMYAKKSIYTEKGLILYYENEDKTKKIIIAFEDGFLSARETEEGAIDKTLSGLYEHCKSTKCDGNIFTIENSNYLRWINEQVFDVCDNKTIKHYLIFSYDIISEIICISDPKITIENNWK